MKFKYPRARKEKGNPMKVSCAYCKTPVARYQKAGKGGLIKMQFYRILEAEIDLDKASGSLICPSCGEDLGSKADYMGKPAFWLTRGKVNTSWER